MKQNFLLNTLLFTAVASFPLTVSADNTLTQAEMVRQDKMNKRAALRQSTVRAHHNDKGFYLGVGAARSSVNSDDFDESETEVGLRAGYMFSPVFGIDVTTVKLGARSTNNLDIDVGVVALSAIAQANLGRTALYGKLGAAKVGVKVENSNGTTRDDSSETELYWGIGAEYDFGKVDAFIEYNRFDTDDADLNTTMVGLKYEF